jgi:hypothetical protein
MPKVLWGTTRVRCTPQCEISARTHCISCISCNRTPINPFQMLQSRTVEPGTLELLKKIMRLPQLSQFLLVGGTALSLKYGHRISVDLDLFSNAPFENQTIIQVLETNFEEFTYSNPGNPIGVFGFIGDVKVDFVKHLHPILVPPTVEEDIRLMSTEDIMAMKINAILKRGVKKDFWDIAELLQDHSVTDFISYYQAKYPTQQLMISIPTAMVYFEDAEESEEPVSLKGQTWEEVKGFIKKKVSEYLK